MVWAFKNLFSIINYFDKMFCSSQTQWKLKNRKQKTNPALCKAVNFRRWRRRRLTANTMILAYATVSVRGSNTHCCNKLTLKSRWFGIMKVYCLPLPHTVPHTVQCGQWVLFHAVIQRPMILQCWGTAIFNILADILTSGSRQGSMQREMRKACQLSTVSTW